MCIKCKRKLQSGENEKCDICQIEARDWVVAIMMSEMSTQDASRELVNGW